MYSRKVGYKVGGREGTRFLKYLPSSHCVAYMSRTPKNEKPSQVPCQFTFLARTVAKSSLAQIVLGYHGNREGLCGHRPSRVTELELAHAS